MLIHLDKNTTGLLPMSGEGWENWRSHGVVALCMFSLWTAVLCLRIALAFASTTESHFALTWHLFWWFLKALGLLNFQLHKHCTTPIVVFSEGHDMASKYCESCCQWSAVANSLAVKWDPKNDPWKKVPKDKWIEFLKLNPSKMTMNHMLESMICQPGAPPGATELVVTVSHVMQWCQPLLKMIAGRGKETEKNPLRPPNGFSVNWGSWGVNIEGPITYGKQREMIWCNTRNISPFGPKKHKEGLTTDHQSSSKEVKNTSYKKKNQILTKGKEEKT